MRLALIMLISLASLAATPTDLQRQVAEQILEDEDIWMVGDERLSDTDQAFFMQRADEAARAIGAAAARLSGEEREDYIENAVEAPDGVRERLRVEIAAFQRTGAKPSTPLAPPTDERWLDRFSMPDPRWLIGGLIAVIVLVQVALILRRDRKR